MCAWIEAKKTTMTTTGLRFGVFPSDLYLRYLIRFMFIRTRFALGLVEFSLHIWVPGLMGLGIDWLTHL